MTDVTGPDVISVGSWAHMKTSNKETGWVIVQILKEVIHYNGKQNGRQDRALFNTICMMNLKKDWNEAFRVDRGRWM